MIMMMALSAKARPAIAQQDDDIQVHVESRAGFLTLCFESNLNLDRDHHVECDRASDDIRSAADRQRTRARTAHPAAVVKSNPCFR